MLFLPLGVTFALLACALYFRKRWPAVVAAAILYLSSIEAVSHRLLGWLELRHPPVRAADLGQADAIVVLGGFLGETPPGASTQGWGEAAERFEAGLELMAADRAPLLVFTGAKMHSSRGPDRNEGEIARHLAIRRGIPAQFILVAGEVRNTAEEARIVSELASRRGWKRVILVTTAWHMPRALWLFQRAGVGCAPFPVDFRTASGGSSVLLTLLPKADALKETEIALREIYGNLYYRISG